MRLCFVGTTGSMHVERWIRYFARHNEVHLLTASAYAAADLPEVTVHRYLAVRTRRPPLDMSLNALALLPNVVRFRKILNRIRPDLVHVHYANEAALLAVLSGARPLVLTAWGSDILLSLRESLLRRTVIRRVLPRVDLITCDAQHMRNALLHLGAPEQRIAIIYFGTDVGQFRPDRRSAEIRARLGVSDALVVISTRRLEAVYDVETLIRSVPHVLAGARDVRFLIVGSGSEEPRLRALARELAVTSAVRFLGWMPEDDLASLLPSADVYVSTALSDGGLAASTAEAMASGLPVIVTDVGDNRQWVSEGENGFLIPARSPGVLAARILHFSRWPQARRAFGQRGREVVTARNNWEVEMDRMAGLYRELIRATTREEASRCVTS